MVDRWPEVTFSDLYEVPSRNGLTIPKATRGSGVPMLGMSELFKDDILRSEDDWELVPASATQCERFGLRREDLLFGRRSLTRAGAGKVSIIDHETRAVFESSLIRVRLDRRRSDPVFFFHYFRSPEGRANMEQIVEQVAVAGIRSSDLSRLRVPLPPLDEQERIAGVLGTFDDLIEVNRLLSRDLLSLLFAKYEALAEGRPTTSFGNVAHLVRDQWKPGSEGPSRYLGLEHFATEGAGIAGVGDVASVQSVSLRFRPGDVLYGKLRPYFRKVARPGFAGLCSSEIWVLRARDEYPQSLVHALTHAASFSEAASAGSTGTRMPRADWKHVSTLPVPDLRPSEVSAEVLAGLESLWSAACDLDDENYNLTRQRDELLPLLMSGRVRVRDLEAVA
ncbi:restriction endonuclease subunit S [Rothia kristinae]|nr:restriction endonuclease subunit S [Rothia kristinae]